MTQLDMFDKPKQIRKGDSIARPPKASAPPTSRWAQQSFAGEAQNHRVSCLTALMLFGPMTAHEVAARVQLHHSQVFKRLSELYEQGKIDRVLAKGSGEFVTRPSPSGRQCCVWKAL